MKRSSLLAGSVFVFAIISQSLVYAQTSTASEQNVKQETVNDQKVTPSSGLNTKSSTQPVKAPANAELKTAEMQKQNQNTNTDPAIKQSTDMQVKPVEVQKQTQKAQNSSSASDQLPESELKDLKEKEAQKAQQEQLKKSSESVPTGNNTAPVQKSATKKQADLKTGEVKQTPVNKQVTNEVQVIPTPKPVKEQTPKSKNKSKQTLPEKQTETPGQTVKENTPAAKSVNLKMPVAEPVKK